MAEAEVTKREHPETLIESTCLVLFGDLYSYYEYCQLKFYCSLRTSSLLCVCAYEALLSVLFV